MRTHKFNTASGTYKLQLTRTYRYDKDDSHEYVNYKFIRPDKMVIFQGNDFGCPMYKNPESKWAAIQLLGFLTCKPGDTDEEYFEHYSVDQLAWCNSFDCEELSLYTMED
jgi:hypothetical protein